MTLGISEVGNENQHQCYKTKSKTDCSLMRITLQRKSAQGSRKVTENLPRVLMLGDLRNVSYEK